MIYSEDSALRQKFAALREKVASLWLSLTARHVLAILMAFHERCINTDKFGCSRHQIADDHDQLFIDWMERDVVQVVKPARADFGSFIVDGVVSMETASEVKVINVSGGFGGQFCMPLDQ